MLANYPITIENPDGSPGTRVVGAGGLTATDRALKEYWQSPECQKGISETQRLLREGLELTFGQPKVKLS